ncbi:MAG: ferredoxin [Syntrophorhabdaceae bacterium]
MKAKIDNDACVGDGTCAEMCPEVFVMEGDLAVVTLDEIPGELQEKVKETANNCPVEAIIIEE